MKFNQLSNFVQFTAAVRTVQTEIADTIALLPALVENVSVFEIVETVTLNAVWCLTFAAAFTFYAGQAAAEAWHTRDYAAVTAEICATPNADLDGSALPILSMAATDIDVIDLGAKADDLATLSVHQLRPLCQSRGIQWRNARGHGKHLAKAEMIAALNQLKLDRPQCCNRAMNSKGLQWRCPLCCRTKPKNPQKRGGSGRGQGQGFFDLPDLPSHCGLPMIGNGSNWLCKLN
ncbi:MAG: hypothetical protein RLZZ511_4215 [Cyanobacteriota bacterium]|jgi:hypothetical protein